MGDRTTRWYKCPHCTTGEVEEYDAPSCLLFTATCNSCDFFDKREYFEIDKNNIILCTPKDFLLIKKTL